MASSLLGLRCTMGQLSPVAMATTMAARRTLTAPRASRVSPSCLCAVPPTKRFASYRRPGRRQDGAPAPSVAQKMQQQQQHITPNLISAPLPGTLIAPPLSQWPKGKAFFRFAYDVLGSRGRRWLQTIMVALASRPKPWQAGLLKLENSKIPPTAKAMYSDMLQALAAGDRDKLKALCTVTYLDPMLASLDKRPRTKRYKWELVKWTGKARIVAQSITPVAPGGGSDLIRQATVHVPSRQRRVEYVWNAGAKEWEVASKKEADVDEYIILVSVIFPKSYHQTEWRILSATRPSTVEEWEHEKELVKKVQSVDMESYKL